MHVHVCVCDCICVCYCITYTNLLATFKCPGTERPNMGELNKFLTKYCGHWRSIGYKLGLSDDVLNLIHSNHPAQERECFRVGLQKWLEQDTSATWSILELAITNACREELSLEALSESKNL